MHNFYAKHELSNTELFLVLNILYEVVFRRDAHEQLRAAIIEVVEDLAQPVRLVLPPDSHHIDGHAADYERAADDHLHRADVTGEGHQEGTYYEEDYGKEDVNFDGTLPVALRPPHVE